MNSPLIINESQVVNSSIAMVTGIRKKEQLTHLKFTMKRQRADFRHNLKRDPANLMTFLRWNEKS